MNDFIHQILTWLYHESTQMQIHVHGTCKCIYNDKSLNQKISLKCLIHIIQIKIHQIL